MVIFNSNKKHSGIYQCFASNRLGTVYSSIVVTVKPGNNSLPSDYDEGNVDEGIAFLFLISIFFIIYCVN